MWKNLKSVHLFELLLRHLGSVWPLSYWNKARPRLIKAEYSFFSLSYLLAIQFNGDGVTVRNKLEMQYSLEILPDRDQNFLFPFRFLSQGFLDNIVCWKDSLTSTLNYTTRIVIQLTVAISSFKIKSCFKIIFYPSLALGSLYREKYRHTTYNMISWSTAE